MRVKRRQLPAGWYPQGEAAVRSQIEAWRRRAEARPETAVAGIVPHAGWGFSGSIALEVVDSLCADLQTLVVIGGHLPPGAGVLAATEDGYETPLGVIEADLELLAELRHRLELRADTWPDNTVEVHLPIIRCRFPRARALALRVEPTGTAVELGEALAEAAVRLGRKVGVLGSTDLTHYGSQYGFSPRGSGPAALEWVREVNDRRLIEALLRLDPQEALSLAARERSACSAGGAAAEAACARRRGCTRSELVRYRTSREVYPGESFVGYAGITYSTP